jgi:hypothetical protein
MLVQMYCGASLLFLPCCVAAKGVVVVVAAVGSPLQPFLLRLEVCIVVAPWCCNTVLEQSCSTVVKVCAAMGSHGRVLLGLGSQPEPPTWQAYESGGHLCVLAPAACAALVLLVSVFACLGVELKASCCCCRTVLPAPCTIGRKPVLCHPQVVVRVACV